MTLNRSSLSEYAFGLPEYAPQNAVQNASAQNAAESQLWATQYYVHYAEATNANGHALLDMNGNSFGVNLSESDWCFGGVEGTIQVKDSSGKMRTYNYAGRGKDLQVDCSKFNLATSQFFQIQLFVVVIWMLRRLRLPDWPLRKLLLTLKIRQAWTSCRLNSICWLRRPMLHAGFVSLPISNHSSLLRIKKHALGACFFSCADFYDCVNSEYLG
jgi:hypothetical protein